MDIVRLIIWTMQRFSIETTLAAVKILFRSLFMLKLYSLATLDCTLDCNGTSIVVLCSTNGSTKTKLFNAEPPIWSIINDWLLSYGKYILLLPDPFIMF